MTTDLIDARYSLNHTISHIQLRHYVIEHAADLFQDSPVGFVLRVEGEHPLSRSIEDNFAKRNSSQFGIFLQ